MSLCLPRLMPTPKRLLPPDIAQRKGAMPLVCLTASTAPMARLLDPHADVLLVGDSLGMALYGLPSTTAVTMDMMAAHGAAVVRSSARACVVVDMPFGSYQQSPQQAFHNAAWLLKRTEAQAVKIEGGSVMAPTIRFLTQRGVAVMAHVGLTPQAHNQLGGFRVQGKKESARAALLDDIHAVADAGAFSVVIEGTVESLAVEMTQNISIPTIGIGASVACDGQILVSEDMLGLLPDFQPKFVRRYAALAATIHEAAEKYAADVRTRRFPSVTECYDG
jgi:3-methyl-2-oxobutanoate hydroxymethyltransferase